MFKLNKVHLFILLVTIAAIGCKKNESDDNFPRNVDIYMRYLLEGNQFNGLAKVSYADTIAIGEPDTATYFFTINGKDMKQVISPGGIKNYSVKANMPFSDQYEVKIKGPDHSITTKSTKIIPIDSFQLPRAISKSTALNIEYFGSPLNANESIIAMLVASDGKTASATLNGPASSKSINIKADKLSELISGLADIYLIRTYSDEDVTGKLHFFIKNEFYSRTKQVELTD
ncbi:MAG TPA: hypothetical protein PL069_02690 [Saprospiraceae bacterium]|nr:hypothetical protein [Saprospiraceae bacterium]